MKRSTPRSSLPSLRRKCGRVQLRRGQSHLRPSTTRQHPDGTWTRDPFPGNIIPPNRIDPVARNILGIQSLGAQPNRAPPQARGQPTMFLPTSSREPSSTTTTCASTITFYRVQNQRRLHSERSERLRTPDPLQRGPAPFDAETGNYSPTRVNNTSVGYTWMISPTLSTIRAQAISAGADRTAVPCFGEGWPQQLGIPNVG